MFQEEAPDARLVINARMAKQAAFLPSHVTYADAVANMNGERLSVRRLRREERSAETCQATRFDEAVQACPNPRVLEIHDTDGEHLQVCNACAIAELTLTRTSNS